MLFSFKLTFLTSLHTTAVLFSVMALRCGRGKATQAACASGAFASSAQADAFIETQATEFAHLSAPAQAAFKEAAPAKRAQLLATFGQLLTEQGTLSKDPATAKTELARLQHGIPTGKTSEGLATLYGFTKLAEATTNAHTRQKLTAKMAALRTTMTTKASSKAGLAAAAQYANMTANPLPVGAQRAIEEYAPGRARCKNCGRYASVLYGHQCPLTATPLSMERALRRRLGLPAGVFGEDTGGSTMYPGPEYLHALIHEANLEYHSLPDGTEAGPKPRGTLAVCNPHTGENQMVTLDGLLVAMQQGYLPLAWQDNAKGIAPVQVVTPKGHVVWVIDPKGLPAPAKPTSPVEEAALASGLDPTLVPKASTLATTGTVKAPSPLSLATTTRPSPTAFSVVRLSGGSVYDQGRFSGNEWRKGAGKEVVDGTRTFVVGQLYRDPSQFATARKNGLYPTPPGVKLRAGNNLVAAAVLLGRADLAKAPDGTYELRDKDKGLVAVYDPASASLGSVYEPTNEAGEPCASPEQWAAVMATIAASPANDLERAFAQDLKHYLEGKATALQVSDGAYIALNDKFKSEAWSPTLGNQLSGVTNCPRCGKFVGANPCPCAPAPVPVPGPATAASVSGEGGIASVPDITSVSGESATPPASQPFDDPATEKVVVAPTATTTTSESIAVAAPPLFDSATFARSLAEGLSPALSSVTRSVEELARRTTEMEARSQEYELRVAALLDAVSDKLTRWPTAAPTAPAKPGKGRSDTSPDPSTPPPVVVKERKAAPPPPTRPDRTGPLTALLAEVEPPGSTDPYLMRVPSELGGQRYEPLPQYYLPLDDDYELSEDGAKAIKMVAASLQLAWNADPARRPKGTQFRAFGFAGTSGTGKNTTARQIAAALAQPYYEMTINKDTSIQEEIGQTVLSADSLTGATVSTARLGKLGQAAASGAVVCVNEVVKANPGILGALQTMMEDGVIEVAGTEAGMAGGRIPVHPNTVFIATWNPGYDGSAQRPDQALLSRLQVATLNAPSLEEQTNRLQKQLDGLLGKGQVSRVKCEAAARFVSELQRIARGGPGVDREIARDSISPAEPTPREALRFVATAEMSGGDYLLALEQFKTYCDAGEDFDNQWRKVRTLFKRIFGDDGRAIERNAAGRGPLTS